MGPSMRFVAEVGDWDRAVMNIVTGESGQPLSSHYRDQWLSYYVGQSFPMAFSKVEGDTLRFVAARGR
jgi:penicillin amidase